MYIGLLLLLANTVPNSFKLSIISDTPEIQKITLIQCKPSASGFENEQVFNLKGSGDSLFFAGEITSPHPFFIEIKNKEGGRIFKSYPFILTVGNQTGRIQNTEKQIIIDNTVMTSVYNSEYYKQFTRLNKNTMWLEAFSDSTANLQPGTIKDSLLQVISNIHRVYEDEKLSVKFKLHESEKLKKSYFSLWMIFFDIYDNGYNEYHQYFYEWLGEELKESTHGQYLSKILLTADKVKLGENLPNHVFYNLKTHKESELPKSSKFTFIDFWFSGCGKCLKEFPLYMEIYDSTDRRLLNIVSISTDYTTSLKYLQEHRNKFKFKWEEFLDENGVYAEKLGFQYFPKNILLNSEGVVIKKNLDPEKLREFIQNKQ